MSVVKCVAEDEIKRLGEVPAMQTATTAALRRLCHSWYNCNAVDATVQKCTTDAALKVAFNPCAFAILFKPNNLVCCFSERNLPIGGSTLDQLDSTRLIYLDDMGVQHHGCTIYSTSIAVQEIATEDGTSYATLLAGFHY